MRKLVLVLIAFIAVVTLIRVFAAGSDVAAESSGIEAQEAALGPALGPALGY
ncbi:MAG: hypothetical protein LBT11_02520 [Treponema sp.]|jgi:small-conductance mechanosensitive channel|nr:hypothetical protein [Treponema sp.]